MPIDVTKIDLDKPVNAYDAEGNLKEKPENISEESSPEVPQTKEKEVEKPEEKEEDTEQRVPYSRFAKIRERAEQAERDAEEARELVRSIAQRREPSRETPVPSSYDEDYAREIKRLYGDTPVSDEIIAINLKHQRQTEERAERRALEAVERARNYETQVVNQNVNVIDQRLEALQDSLGRSLSEKEEQAVLDIVDEYTPTGEDGKYLGEFLPFDKAWEVYELRQQKQVMSSKKNRSAAVAASSSRSEGEPSADQAEVDKNWNPQSWNSLYKRIPKI